jgi:hypothetical protein
MGFTLCGLALELEKRGHKPHLADELVQISGADIFSVTKVWGSGDAETGLVGSKQEDVHQGVKLVLLPVSIGEERWFEGGG